MSCNFELLSIMYLGLIIRCISVVNISYFLSDKKHIFVNRKAWNSIALVTVISNLRIELV